MEDRSSEVSHLPAEESALSQGRPVPVPIGVVTECVAGVDLAVLRRHRADLKMIEHETGAQIVEKPGLYGCTVLVTGPKAIVQQAWLLVSSLLLRLDSAPAAASSHFDAPSPLDGWAAPPLCSPPGLSRPADVPREQIPLPICSPPGLSRPADFIGTLGSTAAAQDAEMLLTPLQTLPKASSPSHAPTEGGLQPAPGMSSYLQMAVQAAVQEANGGACEAIAEASAEVGEAAADRGAPSPSAAKRKKRNEKKKAQKAAAEADEAALAAAAEAAAMAAVSFELPASRPLEGVKSRKKVIYQMENVSYTYAEKGSKATPTLTACNLSLSQTSRVLVTGAKAAGKTTLVKLLACALAPSSGSIRRVADTHVAHLTQEAFQLMESHSARTAGQYCAWLSARAWRKIEDNCDVPEDFEAGPEDFEAAAQCQHFGAKGIAWVEHVRAFGLDPEWMSRAKIATLSAACKVAVLLAWVSWPRPQLLVLDDPASWLDSAAIDAVSKAVASFKGGVVITCHSKYQERFEAIASEKWTLRGGRLRPDLPAEQPAPQASVEQAKIQQELKKLTLQLADKSAMSPQAIKDAMQRLDTLQSMLGAGV